MLCAPTPPASADKLKVGSDLQRPNDAAAICATPGCVGVQQTLSAAKATLPPLSPVNGVVTKWLVRSSDDGALYSLRLLRPAGAGTYVGAGTAPATGPIPAGPEVTASYPASLPVAEGDAIGLMLGAGAAGLPVHFASSVPADQIQTRVTPFADGVAAPFLSSAPYELLVQAKISFCDVPAVKGKKARKSINLINGGQCAARVVKRPTRKRRREGRVLRQRPSGATTAVPGTVVTITVGRRSKHG